ncbi:Gfo/Idh/MocA family protein [Thalassobius sp. Cn5-15]|uniref:Gfo/Idh/MocA family protein n=1 Tax=Thalassobius sp. Cn5-15 TaxID=2917763 RepID=UPI001EF35FB3|nr:Gfo/Idh/MocA family oxidoreductase [Thalassobius sp. Cn5-15]MCG7495017.1 Gfo/Idh/MocA family oxidoreductase [Thalassobius sp. Cn5-15]
MNDKVVKVGLLGLGNMGRNHLRVLSLLKGFELTFICDANTEVVESLGKEYSIPYTVDPTSYLDQVDAVVICTPTVTHADYIRMCAKGVKNIFVEKPLAATLQEAIEISDFAKENELNIQVGFIERFNPAVRSLKTVLDGTEKIISLDFTRTNKVSSRITDVDVITDLMIHDIDLALYLNGPAKSVAAHGFSKGEMTDFASALITHENGQFSRILASRVTDKKIRHISSTCVDMYIDCDLLSKEIIINREAETKVEDDLPYRVSAVREAVAVAPQEALLTELQSFMESCVNIADSNRPSVSAGVAAMQICDQIKTSVES